MTKVVLVVLMVACLTSVGHARHSQIVGSWQMNTLDLNTRIMSLGPDVQVTYDTVNRVYEGRFTGLLDYQVAAGVKVGDIIWSAVKFDSVEAVTATINIVWYSGYIRGLAGVHDCVLGVTKLDTLPMLFCRIGNDGPSTDWYPPK